MADPEPLVIDFDLADVLGAWCEIRATAGPGAADTEINVHLRPLASVATHLLTRLATTARQDLPLWIERVAGVRSGASEEPIVVIFDGVTLVVAEDSVTESRSAFPGDEAGPRRILTTEQLEASLRQLNAAVTALTRNRRPLSPAASLTVSLAESGVDGQFELKYYPTDDILDVHFFAGHGVIADLLEDLACSPGEIEPLIAEIGDVRAGRHEQPLEVWTQEQRLAIWAEVVSSVDPAATPQPTASDALMRTDQLESTLTRFAASMTEFARLARERGFVLDEDAFEGF